jgi:hypothetical protein
MMGRLRARGIFFSASSSPHPLMTGMRKSSSTAAGMSPSSRSSASRPFAAWTVRYPSSSRASQMSVRWLASSSTTRMWDMVRPR